LGRIILEILAISFVAVAAVWFVSAQAWGILGGIREARNARRKRKLADRHPSFDREA
jgi:hypothetical protein